MPTYQPGIPTGTVPLNQDYQNVQGNFQVADTSFGKDHYAFSDSTSNNGYHKVAHLVAISTIASNPPNNFPIVPPPAVGFAGELFTTQSNVGLVQDEILWYQTGGGILAQMTVNLTPVALANGYTFIPGGLILQWGVIAPTSATTVTVTFATANIAFPQNCFNVQVTRQRPTADPGSSYEFYVDNSTISKTQFQVINRDGHSYGFYWYAIGN